MNKQKNLSLDICSSLLSNIAQFMEYIPIDCPMQLWTSVFLELDALFVKLTRIYLSIKAGTNISQDLSPLLRIMMNILKVPYIANVRLVLEPFSKLLTFILQNATFQLEHIIELCSLSNRTFTRVRHKILFVDERPCSSLLN
jgi:protein unc-79